LWGWLQGLWESWGLADWADRRRESSAEWDAINSLPALSAWVAKWGIGEQLAVSTKARELGASDDEIKILLRSETAGLYKDPSTWLATQIQTGFASPVWQELNEVFATVVFDSWLASIVGGKMDPSSPELENVRRFLGTQASFETLGGLISTAGEIASIGQVEQVGKMFTDAKWLLGTCFTSWQSTAPIVQAVILQPLQKLINETFRPADFTRAQWQDLFSLGKIDPGRLGIELARQGYTEEKIGWLLELAKRQPSRGDLLAMWRKDIIGPVEFADGLRKMGYPQEWIERYIELYQDDESSEEKGAYIGTLRKAFREQLIGEAEVREALKRQGRSNEAIDLEIAVLKLSWDVEEKSAAKSDIKAAYFENIIGRPEASSWLTKAGFTEHIISLLLDTWDKQKAPTYRKINKAEILKAWGVGVLTRPEAYQGLRDVGYEERGATVLMETYERSHLAAKLPASYMLKPTDIMWAWHTEVIEEDEVLSRLVDLGLTEDNADLLFESFQRLHPRIVAGSPKELVKSDILEAWGRGVLTEEETLDKLISVGYEQDDADTLIESYRRRPEALPPEPTIAELIGATRRGVIDVAILSQKLTTLGLKAEDVQFYVSYATSPLPEKTRSLSRTDILNLWKLKRHDRAWALERLLAMNYSPEDADDILWLYSPAIEDTETFVLWSAGVIEIEVAVAMWASMGFTDEQIAEAVGG
jgi:hypothetical protein